MVTEFIRRQRKMGLNIQEAREGTVLWVLPI